MHKDTEDKKVNIAAERGDHRYCKPENKTQPKGWHKNEMGVFEE